MTEATFQAARALLRGRSNEPPLQPAPRHCPLPASYAQARLWFLDRLHPESRAYNLAMACRLRGRLDVSALHKALTALVHRHEILRTTLRMVEGELTQQIAPPWPFELPVADVTDLESWTAEKVAQRFDLEHGPLLRVDLARLASDHACLLVVQHHAICDAWSFEVFMRELGALYEEAPLEALPLHYADFAYWEQQRLRTNGHASLVEYWTHQLDGNAPLLQLPADRARLSRSRRRAGNQIMRVPRGLTETLKALAAREGATLYMVLLGVFQTLLHRYTGEEDVLVGTPIAGRNHAQLQNVLGLFINTLPMRVDLSGRPVFRQLLGRVRETVTGALAHQELPLEAITRELRLSRSGDSAPLFEVLFAFQNIPRTPWRWSGLEIEAWEVPPPETKFDLALTMQETPEGLNAVFEYDADRFEDATITRMLQHLATLFEAVAAQPDRPIADLPLASLEPSDWNHTAVPYPRHEPVHRLFEQQVHRTPTAVAVVSDEESLTYDALNRRANQLAHRLAQLRLAPEALVGLRLRRSASFIVAQLAVLKAGLTYVPLDAEQSNARTADIMKKLAAVVMDGPMPTTAANPVLAGDPSLRLESDGDLDERVTSEQLAYVMFTSGSTGIPRGVCIPHRGIVRLVRGTTYARLGPGEVFLQLAPPSFDAATFEVWGALLGGNTLVVAPSRPLAIAEIGEIIRRHEVTMLWLTSGLFELFVDGGLDYLGSVRQLLTGGDTLSASHAERFVRRMKHCQLINCYGPTENTTFTCTHTVEHVDAADIIPIGRPIANTSLYVLDASLHPVPLGAAGEAWVGGDGLARGYLDDQPATNERFLPNPFKGGERLYRTGDRVRRRPDGTLEFLGRIDQQIKLRGFRIEPAEIEQVLRRCPEVRSAAVIATDGKHMIAYVVPRRCDGNVLASAQSFLREQMPDPMIPSRFVIVDHLPLTPNGKLDRRALPPAEPPPRPEPVAPRNLLEEKLVALFASVLETTTPGIHDSFFEAGGDSLSAMRLLAAIEKDIGKELPLAMLFDEPTVAQLADELSRRPKTARSTLVLIKEGRSPRPLFLVAGGGGTMTELNLYAKLLSRLSTEDTVFGLTAPEEANTMEDIAAQGISGIRHRQPRGPYRIGGECVGGLVAWEMAQQLVAAGEKIELLLLMDTWYPSNLGVLHDRFVKQLPLLLKLGLSFLAGLPKRDPCAEPWPVELGRRATDALLGTRYSRTCMRYRPRPFPGRVTLIAAEASMREGIATPWHSLAGGGVTIHHTAGNHETYVREHTQTAAEALRACLEEHPL